MKEILVKEHKNNLVSKGNELIRAKGALSGTAQKMLASVISMIRVDDTNFQEYALRVDDYLKLIGSKSNNKNFMKEQAEQLMQNPFRIDGKLFNWCSMVDLERMEGYIIFDVHHKLKPYLLELRERGNFTQYKIVNVLSLRGDYSPRLYEYFTMKFNQYIKYNEKATSYTFELKIEELRSFLGVPNSYKFYDIKRRIIEKALTDFKKYTDIKFDYKVQKIGKKVDRLIVTIRQNDQGSNNYLKSKQAFISYLRNNFVNADILEGKDKTTDKKIMISIGPSGKLYDKYGLSFDSIRSSEIWETLYKRAIRKQLEILNIS